MRKTKLEDWPLNVRKQIEAQLKIGTRGESHMKEVEASIKKDGRQINGTEALYNRTMLNGQGMFEAVTLRLKGGSRYTPDFVTFNGDRMHCHEVKGTYRLHSQGRAVTVFKECVATFCAITFTWAEKQKDGSFRTTVFNVKG
jgi:hypothetical protein